MVANRVSSRSDHPDKTGNARSSSELYSLRCGKLALRNLLQNDAPDTVFTKSIGFAQPVAGGLWKRCKKTGMAGPI